MLGIMSANPDPTIPDANAMFAIVYDELRGLAQSWWRDQQPGQTIQPTALVHEAFLKMAQGRPEYHDEEHFRAIAARAMHQALVQHFRAKHSLKRGGSNRSQVTLTGIESDGQIDPAMVMALDEAIGVLERLNERKAQVVEMRYFGGMNESEIARVLGVSERTIRTDWRLTRAWLSKRLAEHDHGNGTA
tara:strand:- start:7021 stop:7587 length:567 start_codon:yes stop_codon:yes gene_type:complete